MSRLTMNSNIASLGAQRYFGNATKALNDTFTRLSSGLRINKASDDAAGLSIASNLNFESRIYNQAKRNVSDGISLLSIAESATESLRQITTRQQELAEQAANGIYGTAQRLALDNEALELTKEYNRIINTTSFNGINIFTNGSNPTITIQHGFGTLESTQISTNSFISTSTSSIVGALQEISWIEFTDGAFLTGTPGDLNPNVFRIHTPEGSYSVNIDYGFGETPVTFPGDTLLIVGGANGDSFATSSSLAAALNATGHFTTSVTNNGPNYGVEITNITAGAVSNISGLGSITTQEGSDGVVGAGTTILAEDINLTTIPNALSAITTLAQRSNALANGVAQLGAIQSRLGIISSVVDSRKNLLKEAETRITEADIGEESSNLVKNQILQQAAMAVLSQANLTPELVLRLLS